MKTCIYCNKSYHIDFFVKKTNGCKKCRRQYQRIMHKNRSQAHARWVAKNKEKVRAYNKKYSRKRKLILKFKLMKEFLKKVWESRPNNWYLGICFFNFKFMIDELYEKINENPQFLLN